jgi:hypothetical protein
VRPRTIDTDEPDHVKCGLPVPPMARGLPGIAEGPRQAPCGQVTVAVRALPAALVLLCSLAWSAGMAVGDPPVSPDYGATDAQPRRTPLRPCCVDAPAPEVREDPWWPELRGLVEDLSDAYTDKPHKNRLGQQDPGEPAWGRVQRLDAFTRDVIDAARRITDTTAAWNYAGLLVWLAHRETRIAASPEKLGDQDEHRAAGPWQMWVQADRPTADRFSAAEALSLLLRAPGAWYLPAGAPWAGYTACARWLAAHPAP